MEETETYLTSAGEVVVQRHLYRAAGRSTRHICPLELQAGIVEGFFAPMAARRAAYVVAHVPPATGAALFVELGSMQPSASSLERLPKGLSACWEGSPSRLGSTPAALSRMCPRRPRRWSSRWTGSWPPCETPRPTRLNPKEAEKQPTGPKGYQEVGCGTVSLHDAEGERLQTVRYGRMPESKKATLCAELEAEVQAILAVQPHLKVVKLADGARDNWRFLDTLNLGVPAGQIDSWDIVDFYHACDHLKHAVDTIWGEQTPKGKGEFARLKTLLKEADNGVERVIETLRYRVRKAKGRSYDLLRKELTYFRNQRHRMKLCRLSS